YTCQVGTGYRCTRLEFNIEYLSETGADLVTWPLAILAYVVPRVARFGLFVILMFQLSHALGPFSRWHPLTPKGVFQAVPINYIQVLLVSALVGDSLALVLRTSRAGVLGEQFAQGAHLLNKQLLLKEQRQARGAPSVSVRIQKDEDVSFPSLLSSGRATDSKYKEGEDSLPLLKGKQAQFAGRAFARPAFAKPSSTSLPAGAARLSDEDRVPLLGNQEQERRVDDAGGVVENAGTTKEEAPQPIKHERGADLRLLNLKPYGDEEL
ncbi:unnamed protein product, partial [Amoebophrya sp. A25]